MTTKASEILKRHKALSEGEQVGGKAKGKEQVGDGGSASLKGVVEKLMKENFSKDNDSQEEAVKGMGKLAKSDDKMANKFMEAMDKAASNFALKEALKDISNGDGKDADDQSEEEGDYKKGGKKGEPAQSADKKKK